LRIDIDEILNSFTEKEKKDPNYKVLKQNILDEVERALDPNSRKIHDNDPMWLTVYNFIRKRPYLLVIISIIIGACIANVELLKTIISIFGSK
jgi:hypothetical protein